MCSHTPLMMRFILGIQQAPPYFQKVGLGIERFGEGRAVRGQNVQSRRNWLARLFGFFGFLLARRTLFRGRGGTALTLARVASRLSGSIMVRVGRRGCSNDGGSVGDAMRIVRVSPRSISFGVLGGDIPAHRFQGRRGRSKIVRLGRRPLQRPATAPLIHRDAKAGRRTGGNRGSSSRCVWAGLRAVGHLRGGAEGVHSGFQREQPAGASNARNRASRARRRGHGE